MTEETTNLICRIDKCLKKAFEQVAKSKDLTVSQMIRGFIRDEVVKFSKENTQRELFREPTTQKREEKAEKKGIEGKKALLDMYKKR